MTTKEVTVRDIFEAIKKNGIEHIRGSWVTFEDSKPIGACLLGQGAINLHALGSSIQAALDKTVKLEYKDIPRALTGPAYQVFDYEKNRHVNMYTNGPYGAGTLLVNMNDSYNARAMKYRFSWKQLITKAEKLLSPHFDKTVEVEVWEIGY